MPVWRVWPTRHGRIVRDNKNATGTGIISQGTTSTRRNPISRTEPFWSSTLRIEIRNVLELDTAGAADDVGAAGVGVAVAVAGGGVAVSCCADRSPPR
jgi:hypothetical protein